MAAYAGLIDRVDQELGRLVADLERAGELDSTFILFLSDNGACPYDRRHVGLDREPYLPTTTWSDSTGWAWVRNAPFRFYKQNQYEGGIATPAIVHWPAGLKTKPGSICHQPAHLIDVLPTVAELAGATLPTEWPGRELTPVSGVSLAPILAGEALEKRPPIHLLFSTDRGLRDGDWKIVSFRNHPWELYDMAADRTELDDLAASRPDVRDRLVKLWHDMAENVLPRAGQEPPAGGHGGDTAGPSRVDRFQPGTGGLAFRKTCPEEPAGRNSRRKETKLMIEGQQFVLTCTGTDSGIAMDTFATDLPTGPLPVVLSTSKPGRRRRRGLLHHRPEDNPAPRAASRV